jgi:hypothetical protein
MKQISLFLALVLLLGTSSCRWKHVKGSGVIITKDLHVNQAQRIRLTCSADVYITQGPVTSVKIEGDDNIVSLFEVREEDGGITIRTKKSNISFSTESEVKVYITTNKLSSVKVSGSGNVHGVNKFTGSDKITTGVSGSGNITLDLNAPEVESEVTGSGNIVLTGETANQKVRMSGSGDYNGEALKSESSIVRTTGSGDTKLFADAKLEIHISGSGSVYYKGDAVVTQHVTGSGDLKKID